MAASLCQGHAQTKKWEHNIFASGGLFIDHTDGKSQSGTALRIGYGLNYYFSEHWSAMPAVALRTEWEGSLTPPEGADQDYFSFVDIPLTLQYHVAGQGNGWVLGLGPVFSFDINHDKYYNDANPNDPIDGQTKLRTFALGLQPSVLYQLGKFRLGVEGNIGLNNVAKHYPTYQGSKHLHNIMASVYYHF